MIKLKDNPIEGISLKMGGYEIIIPALNIKMSKMLKKESAQLSDTKNPELQQAAMLKIIFLSIKRNYPEVTMAEIEEIVDIKNIVAAIFACMGQDEPKYLGEQQPVVKN
jgi:hypothetical protein